MKYEIQIGSVFDISINRNRPKHTYIISEEQKHIIEKFAHIQKDEELNNIYIINDCKFKISLHFPDDYAKNHIKIPPSLDNT